MARWILVVWTGIMGFLLLKGCADGLQDFNELSEAGQAGATVGMLIGSMMIFCVWLIGALPI